MDKICTVQESLGLVEYGLITFPNTILKLLKAGTFDGKQLADSWKLMFDKADSIQPVIIPELIENPFKVTFVIGKELVGIIITIVEPAGIPSVIWIFRV